MLQENRAGLAAMVLAVNCASLAQVVQRPDSGPVAVRDEDLPFSGLYGHPVEGIEADWATRQVVSAPGPASIEYATRIGSDNFTEANPSALSVVAPTHATIGEADLTHPLRIVDVPAIHQDWVPHQGTNSDHIQLFEFVPLGDQN